MSFNYSLRPSFDLFPSGTLFHGLSPLGISLSLRQTLIWILTFSYKPSYSYPASTWSLLEKLETQFANIDNGSERL